MRDLLTLVVEVRPTVPEPELRAALVRCFDPKAKNPPAARSYCGVELAETPAASCAIVGKYAVLGSRRSVERAVDARTSGRSVASPAEYADVRAKIGPETIGFMFVTPGAVNFIRFMQQLNMQPRATDPAARAKVEQLLLGMTAHASKHPSGIALEGRGGVMFLSGVAATIAIPSLRAARRAANESAAIGSLRVLASAEATHKSAKNRYATIDELVRAGFIEKDWSNGGVRNNYRISQVSVTATAFELKAEPIDASNGRRAFNVVEDYVIRYARGVVAPAGRKATPLGVD